MLMLFPTQCRSRYYLWLSTLISLSVLFLLLTILAACNNALTLRSIEVRAQPMPQGTIKPATEKLPHLLGVIQMPSGHGLTSQGIIHPNGNAYILNYSGSIIVADGPNLVELMTWPPNIRKKLRGITISPSSHLLQVIDYRHNTSYIITSTQIMTTVAGIGVDPKFIATHPQSGYVYVASAFREPNLPKSGGVSVISGTEVIDWIPIGRIPYALTVNPVDGLVYVGYNPDKETLNSLTVISGTTILTSTSFADTGGSGIEQMIVHSETGEMYLKQGINVVHHKIGSQISSVNIGGKGQHLINSIALDTQRNWIYATSWEEPTGQVLVLEEEEVIASIPVGRDPRDVVVDETRDYVYVVNRLTGSMSVIRGTEVITTVGTEGWGPTFITLDEQRGYVYVSNSDSASVAVFGFDDPSH